tara:strand:- start:2041 stop:2607 length:567 start_codon:yes stop_codon:yes gene_type:complete
MGTTIKIILFLSISTNLFAKMGTDRLPSRVNEVSSSFSATKYSIEELAIFKAFTNTTKVKDFLIGDNGEGGGTKDFQVEREINELLQILPEKLNDLGKGEINISHTLAKARKNHISLFSISSYTLRKNYLFKEDETISLEEIEYFFLSELKKGEEIFTFSHLKGFKTKSGKTYFAKYISSLRVQVTSD